MNINEQYHDLELLDTAPYQYIGRDGVYQERSEPLIKEHLMDVYINDKLTMKLICIPQLLTELVLGRLLTEGLVQSTEEIEHIYICKYGKRAKVYLREAGAACSKEFVEITPTCCTGNHILNDYFLVHTDVRPVAPIPWEASQIFSLVDHFCEGLPLYDQTTAVHSCLLAQGDKLLFQCEDIGRHNALDKAIGYALRHGTDLTKCIVYSSGRIATDMVMRTIRAGIPILASKASPSQESIVLAKEYGLTLVCAARRDRMKLFTGTSPNVTNGI